MLASTSRQYHGFSPVRPNTRWLCRLRMSRDGVRAICGARSGVVGARDRHKVSARAVRACQRVHAPKLGNSATSSSSTSVYVHVSVSSVCRHRLRCAMRLPVLPRVARRAGALSDPTACRYDGGSSFRLIASRTACCASSMTTPGQIVAGPRRCARSCDCTEACCTLASGIEMR